MADSEVRQKFDDPCTAQLKREAREKQALLQDVYDEGFAAGMRVGEIAMKEKAAAVCELGNSPHIGCLANSPEGNIYVPSGGTCHVAMARAIRALPLSGAEESKKEKA